MKARDIANLSLKELEEKLKELRNTFSSEYVKTKVGSKTEKPVNLRNLRKDIARVLTIINLKKKKLKEEKKR